jgi:adenylyltransferase/sulfurtransferase
MNRYIRQIQLEEIGLEGQKKIQTAKILVVGAGGLGCPVLQYLTAAGVGNIGIIDFDIVQQHNLQRQILFNENDIGQNKAITAKKHLQKLNSEIEIEVFAERLNIQNAHKIIQKYDIIIDCTDNFHTRYLIDEVCVHLEKTWIFGAVQGFEGQISTFNQKINDLQRSATYRCLFPIMTESPNCNEIGILGVTPAFIGILQATEALKIILQLDNTLKNRLFLINVLTLQTQIIHVKRVVPQKNEQNNTSFQNTMKEIHVRELNQMLKNNEAVQLIDVREESEYEICHLEGAILIPVSQVPNQIEKISKDKPVIVYCHHGVRSANVINYLKKQHQYTNLYNLMGGIHAWALHIDRNMPTY